MKPASYRVTSSYPGRVTLTILAEDVAESLGRARDSMGRDLPLPIEVEYLAHSRSGYVYELRPDGTSVQPTDGRGGTLCSDSEHLAATIRRHVQRAWRAEGGAA